MEYENGCAQYIVSACLDDVFLALPEHPFLLVLHTFGHWMPRLDFGWDW